MNVVGTIAAKLLLNIENFNANMTKVQNDIEATVKKFDGMNKLGSGLSQAGSKLTKSVTLPIVGLGTAAVKTASDFEAGMSKVKAISGATGDDMVELKDKALEMGAKTKFSAKESADAFTYMAMAGWDAEAMIDGIEGVMNLAAADGLDLATTSDIVTDSLTAFGLTAKDSAEFADVLAVAASASNTSVSMLGESFKYVAPVAGALEYSVEDVSVALGIMANAGIKSSQAGTTLRASLSNMVKPTDAAAKIMDKYNISLTNQDGSMKSFSEVIGDLRRNLGGLTEAQQANAAATLFGDTAMSGMLALINSSDSDYTGLTEQINNAGGTAKQMAETMQDNLAGSMEELGGALETLAIKLGDVLVPVIRDIVVELTSLVDKLGEMDEGTLKTGIKIAGFAAILGPVMKVVGGLMKGISLLKGAFLAAKGGLTGFSAATGVALGPVLAIVAAIGALVAAFVHLWKNNDEFRDKMTSTWNGLVSKVKPMIENIKKTLVTLWDKVLKPIVDFVLKVLKPVFEGVFTAISGVLGGIIGVISGALDVITGLFTGDFSKMGEGIKSIFTGIWDALVGILTGAWEIITGVLEVVLDAFVGIFTTVFEALKEFFTNLWQGIKEFFTNLWDGIVETFTNVLNGIKEFFVNIWNGIKDAAISIWTGLKDGITNIINGIKNTIQNIWNSIKNAVVNVVTGIKDGVINIFTKLKDGIGNAITKVKDTIVGGIQKAMDFIISLPKKALEWGKDIVMGIVDGIKNAINKVGDAVKGVASKIKSFLGFSVPEDGPLKDFETYMPDMIAGLSKTLQKAAPTLYGKAKEIAGNMSDLLQLKPELAFASAGGRMGASDGGIGKTTSNLEKVIKENGNDKSQVIIEKIEVRDDEDIRKLTKGIYDKNDKSLRALGRRNLR